MCRLLLVKASAEFRISEYLEQLARISQRSKEYQGHGWGCAYLQSGRWQIYKNIQPIWEDDLKQFGQTTLLVGHARSAFKDEGIAVENNMPFYDDPFVFIFNGELRGVRISEQGRIGAEKIFNFVKRFYKGDMLEALRKATQIIQKRTNYIRAMNIIIADRAQAYVASLFNEEPEYFTLHYSRDGAGLFISSEALPAHGDWQKIENHTVRVFQ